MSAKPDLITLVLVGALLGCGGAQTPKPTSDPLLDEPSESGSTRAKPRATELVREGEALLQKGDAQGAKAKFEAQLAEAPDDARAWLGLGLAEEALGNVAAAEKAYREAIASDASLAEAHNNLGLILREQDRLDEAVAALEAAVRADPKLASAQANLALAYEDQGRVAEAAQAYREAIKLSPGDAMLRVNHGLFLLSAGEGDPAVRELRAAFENARGDRAVLVAVGNGMRRAGKPEEAVRALEAALAGGDGKPTPALLSELALAQHAAGASEDAKKSLKQALELDPKYASAHYVLASLLAGEGKKNEAIQHYQRCIDLEPKGPLAEKAREKLKAVKAMR